MKEFIWPARVYYEDTDAGGVVYYANYLKFMERARTEWLRHLGFEQDRLLEEEGVLFAVRRVAMDLLKPARFNDLLQVSARIVDRRRASLTFEQGITNVETDELLCRGEIQVACIDAARFKPCAIPATVIKELPNGV